MFENILQKLDNGARAALPFVVTLLFAFLSVVALPLPYLGTVMPPLALISVYYWSLHRPDLFGPGLAFLIGLLFDIINYLPPGLSALLFVGVQQIVYRQRRFFAGHSFFMMWTGFTLTVLTVMLCEWFLLCIIRWQAMPFLPVFVQSLMVIIIFPIPCWILIRLQRAFLSLS